MICTGSSSAMATGTSPYMLSFGQQTHHGQPGADQV